MLSREYFIEELTELASFFPVVVLVGPRQVGKTTLAKLYAASNNKEYIYLDMERPSDEDKLKDAERYLTENSNKLIIIDEVQRKPELFSLLRSLVDDNPSAGRFILLGSASPHIIKGISETLAGRSYLMELYPFSLSELKDIVPFENQFFYGGFPKAVLTSSPKMATLWLKGFIQTYLERDLPMLDMPATPAMMRRLWSMIAHQNGQLTNYSAIGNALGLSYNTIKKYLDFMEGAFLITQLQSFTPNSSKKLVKSPKVYIRDTGILHTLIDIKNYDQLQGHIALGGAWETYILAQLRSGLSDEYSLYFYRTHAGAEIDVIITKSEIAIATVEIKYSTNPSLSRGYYSALDDIGVDKNYIIVPGNADYPIHEKARIIGVQTFITKYLPEFRV